MGSACACSQLPQIVKLVLGKFLYRAYHIVTLAETIQIPIARLKIPKYNVRVSNVEKELSDLKTSIKSVGLVQSPQSAAAKRGWLYFPISQA